MDDAQNGGGYTPPAGLTPVGAPQPIQASQPDQSGSYTPPAGLTPVGAPVPLGADGNPAPPTHNDEIKVTKPWYTPSGIAQRVGSAAEGIGEGVFSTGAGLADLGDKVAGKVDHMMGRSDKTLGDVVTGQEHHSQASRVLHHLAGDDNTKGSSNIYNKAGYGGETVLEMIMGDEALKGLSTADKALQAGKTLKTLEKSPKLMQALKIGAENVSKQAVKAAAVQGGQTFIRSGGDLHDSAVSALEGGATAGVLGTVFGTAGHLAAKAGEAGETAANLADRAANAPETQGVKENIQGQLKNAKDALHENYEAGINDIQDRLGDTSVPVKGSPLAERAKALLAKPDPDDHDLTKAAKELAGEKLDKSTRDLLQSYADGTKPLTDEDIAAAKEASKPTGLVGADGKPLPTETVEPQAKPADPLTARDLVAQRQAIRKAASQYEPGDLNARALNNLLFGFDDTMDQIAAKSGDPDAVADYQKLRGDYKTKIGVYNNNPVIKNLMEGKLDDAAKGFLATKTASGLPAAGKTDFNTQDLKEVLGDKGFDQFRTSVFNNLLKNTSDSNGFNPAKFVSTWGKIADRTKSDFFGAGDPKIAPQSYITSLAQDAKTAANMQKLVRLGLLSGVGLGSSVATAGATAVAGPVAGTAAVGGISTMLGLLIGHGGEAGGGIAKGRELLDYVANHPKTWAALRTLGKASASPTASTASNAITTGARAVEQMNNNSDTQGKNQDAYDAAQGALSGAPTNPSQGSQSTPVDSSVPTFDVGSSKGKPVPGMLQIGNVDVNHRPDIVNDDGSHSSIFSMTAPVNKDGSPWKGAYDKAPAYALIPSIVDGKFLTKDGKMPKTKQGKEQLEDAANEYYAKSRQHLGVFKTAEDAEKYASMTHAYGNDGTDRKVFAPSPEHP